MSTEIPHAVEFAIVVEWLRLVEAARSIPGHIEGRIPHREAVARRAAVKATSSTISRSAAKTGGQVIVRHREHATDTGLAAIFALTASPSRIVILDARAALHNPF